MPLGERPRVAVVYHFLPHYRRAVFQKLKESAAYRFDIFYGDNLVDRSIKTDDGLHGAIRLPVRKVGPAFWQGQVSNHLRPGRYQAVIFLGQANIVSYWLDAVRARRSGAKVLFWTHGWLRRETGPKAAVRAAFYKLADSLLLYGHRARQIGLDKGFADEGLKVIFNSLDYAAQSRVRRGLEAEGETTARHGPLETLGPPYENLAGPYVLCIGRLTAAVRLDLAIAALARIREHRGQRVPLVLIGDGPERSRLETMAREAGVDVVFLGALYDETDIGPWLYNARLVVSPGKVGLTAMHALAYGVPVITHDNFDDQRPEFEAIEPGVTGDFFKVGRADDLADVLERWLDKPRTAQERAAAIGKIESSYTPDGQAALIEEELDRLLGACVATTSADQPA